MRTRRGTALASVLFLCTACLLTLTLSMTAFFVSNGFDQSQDAQEGARRLAESTAHLVVARLLQNPDLTAADFPGVEVPLTGYPSGKGMSGLDPDWARKREIPCCINNLKGKIAVQGWGGGSIAPETANVIAEGHFRGRKCRLEVILHTPPFPYVVASSVPLRAQDGFQVFALKSLGSLANGLAAVDPSEKLPGHILTNAADSGANKALQLRGANNFIQGDAQSHGSVLLESGSVVSGEIREGVGEVPLPEIDIADLDVLGKPEHSDITSASLGATQFSGYQRRQGNLDIRGGLELRNSVLYVDGALTIQGGVSGKGAIIATGPVTVEGGGALSGDQQTAIVAGGSVRLHGQAGQSAEYRGLIYTRGDLDCRNAEIVGGVVVNNPQTAGDAYLEKVTLAQLPELTKLTLDVNSTTTATAPAQMLGRGPLTAAQFQGTPGLSDLIQPMELYLNLEATWDPVAKTYHYPPGADYFDIVYGLGPNGEKVTGRAALRTLIASKVQPGALDEGPPPNLATPIFNPFQPGQRNANQITPSPDPEVNRLLWADYWMAKFEQLSTWRTAMRAAIQVGLPPATTSSTTQTQQSNSTWTLDLSDFAKLSDRIRVQTWRTI